jgi:hypothetical protein
VLATRHDTRRHGEVRSGQGSPDHEEEVLG